MKFPLFHPGVERLDSRTLPSSISMIDLGFQGKVLNLQGSNSHDVIVIRNDAVRVNQERLVIPPGTVGIYADGNDGHDVILNLQQAIPVLIHGGGGNDFILTRNAENFQLNIIYGDDGNDRIVGDPQANSIIPYSPDYMTTDILGPVVFFYDGRPSPTFLNVSPGPDGTTIVFEREGETNLPPEIRVGVFDLGPGDDFFLDSSLFFTSIVYGGDGLDTIVADVVFEDDSQG